VTPFTTSYALLWLLAVLNGVAIVALVRQLSSLRDRLERGAAPALDRLPAGVAAPQVAALDLRSGEVVETARIPNARNALLFLSADCSACRVAAQELARVPSNVLGRIAVYCSGARRGCHNLISSIPASVQVLVQADIDVANIYRVTGYPVGVAVDAFGKIVAYRYGTDMKQLIDTLSRDVLSNELEPSRTTPSSAKSTELPPPEPRSSHDTTSERVGAAT
jgi:hypothetical protein